MRLSKAIRSAKASALMSTMNNGSIELYTGNVPTTVDTSVGSQILLATFSISPTAGTISSGVFTANSIDSVIAVASGTAAWYRQIHSNGSTVMRDGTITATASGGDMTIGDVAIASAQTVNFISWTETEGNGD